MRPVGVPHEGLPDGGRAVVRLPVLLEDPACVKLRPKCTTALRPKCTTKGCGGAGRILGRGVAFACLGVWWHHLLSARLAGHRSAVSGSRSTTATGSAQWGQAPP